jgi:histidinol-phosphatase
VTPDLELAFELADLSARLALPRFEQGSFDTAYKPDGSPVTDVDRLVETAMRSRLAELRPDHAVLGEEYGASGDGALWRWYLDPIDGTTAFISEDARWMTLIALAHRDEVVLGLVNVPALGERWWATRGGGAFHNGEAIAVSPHHQISEAVVNDDWDETLARGITPHPLASVAARCARVRPHQGHSFLGVASGAADVAIELGCYPWDFAPLKIIVEEAGGRFSDFAGRPRIDARDAIVTNGAIHGEALAAARGDG